MAVKLTHLTGIKIVSQIAEDFKDTVIQRIFSFKKQCFTFFNEKRVGKKEINYISKHLKFTTKVTIATKAKYLWFEFT